MPFASVAVSLRDAVELHGSEQLKGKSDDLLEQMDKLGQALGGPPLAQALANSLCATCGLRVDPERDFRDELSREEWDLSRMCQGCQDAVFSGEEEP